MYMYTIWSLVSRESGPEMYLPKGSSLDLVFWLDKLGHDRTRTATNNS